MDIEYLYTHVKMQNFWYGQP